MSTITIENMVPKPARLRKALARNVRERRAIELALRASEFVSQELREETADDQDG